MGIEFQKHLVSVDIARGFRQFQKADSALSNGNVDSSVKHLNKGLDRFAAAEGHVLNAVDDAYSKAGTEIGKGNQELRACIDDYGNGKTDRAKDHYDSALVSYDNALDLIG